MKCHLCNEHIAKKDILKQASEQVNRNICLHETEQGMICENCISSYLQNKRKSISEEKLLSLYSQTLKMHQFHWSNVKYETDIPRYIDRYMNLVDFKSDSLYHTLKEPLPYRTMTIKEIFSNYNTIAASVMGVGLPNDISIPLMNPSLVSAPEHEFGLMKLPRKNDFIVIVKSNYDKISILEQSLNEMRDICYGKISSRAGAAGGIMLPDNQCKSLSKVTTNERVLCVRSKGVGLSLTYRNYDGAVKGRNSIYNDLYMSRFNAKMKFRKMLKSVAMQRLVVTEMVSRLRTFILLDKENIIPIERSLDTFLRYSKERHEMEAAFLKTGRSLLESKLLSWACTTGEMRNHQAVKSHFDGNKSHPVETMSLFGRLPIDINNLNVDYLSTMQPGYLILPLEGVTIKMNCGTDLIHCSLKRTLHLADNSRNTCNWTKVHGP